VPSRIAQTLTCLAADSHPCSFRSKKKLARVRSHKLFNYSIRTSLLIVVDFKMSRPEGPTIRTNPWPHQLYVLTVIFC
jgi:hypothetical protein